MAKVKKKPAHVLILEEEQPYAVPENWNWITVGSINKYQSKSIDPSEKPDNEYELYSVPSSEYDYPELVTGKEIGSTKAAVRKDDVLLCKINPRINRVWIVKKYTDRELLASSEWIIIRNGKILPAYLMYCFRSPYFRKFMLSNVSGVGGSLMRAQPKFVSGYPVPIPPLPEQHRIVDCIESLFAKLDEAKEKAQAVVDGFEDRKAAVLHQAFTGKLTAEWRKANKHNFSDWKEYTYGELGSSKLGKMLDKEKNTGKPVAYLRNVNVRWFKFDLEDVATMLATDDEIVLLEVKEGDLFICEGGEPGRCAVWHGDSNGMIFQKALHRFRPNSNVLSEYLCFYVYHLNQSGELQKYFTGTTIKHLTGQSLSRIPIKVPCIEEQKQIVSILSAMEQSESQLIKTSEQVIFRIDAMKKAILARAFRGELGTNDPSEPPVEINVL